MSLTLLTTWEAKPHVVFTQGKREEQIDTKTPSITYSVKTGPRGNTTVVDNQPTRCAADSKFHL